MRKRIILTVVLFLTLAMSTGCTKKEVFLKNYLDMEYTGYSGYASVTITLNKTGFASAITEAKLMNEEEAIALAESIDVTCDNDRLANGDVLDIKVTYDEVLSADGVNMKADGIKVSDVKEPKVYDAFEYLGVTVSGVSPKACVSLTNSATDEHLSSLEYEVSPEENVKSGDTLTVRLCVDELKDAQEGIVYLELSKEYTVGEINAYPEEKSDIDLELIREIDENNRKTLKSECEDTTTHMMWRMTGDNSYLTCKGQEDIIKCELEDVYWLSEKNCRKGRDNNYIYFVYGVTIKHDDATEDGYFIFEYKNAVMSGGELIISTGKPADRYTGSKDYEELYERVIGSKTVEYYLEKITDI